jgi:hypothetical protein
MLTVKVLRGVNLRNVAEGTTERQDPYVTLTLEENPKVHSKTDVCYSGGMNPQWFSGNWMRLPVPQPNMTCLVQVWDKHSQDADELIASGSIKLGRYDEDGAEEEPKAVDLYWQNGLQAGQLHLIFSYDPPVSTVSAGQVQRESSSADTEVRQSEQTTQETQFEQRQTPEPFVPWMNLQIRHKSGKVKDFVISRTRTGFEQGYTRGRTFVKDRVPQARSSLNNQVSMFKARPMYQQSLLIAAAILFVVLPWPRALAYALFSNIYAMFASFGSSLYSSGTSLFNYSMDACSSMFTAMSTAAGYVGAFMWRSAWYIGLYIVAPIATLLFLPRFVGWMLTRLGTMVLGGQIVSFGTVTFVPWMTDWRRLKFRLILVDFLLGNPRDKGFTPRFVSFNRFEFVGSIAYSDMWRTMTFNYQPCPLKDVRDFKRLSSVRVDHLEIDGLTVNMEVNDKNKLNILDVVSEFDRAHVDRALALKELLSPTFRFPNCLEVQVLGARNLRSMDSSGLSDPYYTVQVRKQQLTSTTVVKTLNPAFPPRVEQFFLNDPSAVVSIVLQDEDVARPSDFIGQWNMTAKWLLINPKKCKHVEWERLSEEDRRQGWIGFWAPLVDENFREEGRCGDVHVRVRWVFNPALPDVRPGERRETQTPLQQLNMLRHEIRQRLGDLNYIFDILKHIPILIDYQGPFVINDTKLSIHDVLYGRRHHADNVVTKILATQREETERRQAKMTADYPRSLEVRETVAAVDRDKVKPVDMGVQPSTTTTTKTTSTTTQMATKPKNDGIDEVIITSADPNQKTLPRNLNVEIDTKSGTGKMATASSTATKVSPMPAPSSSSSTMDIQHEANKSTGMTLVTKGGEKDVMSKEERDKFQRDREREQLELQQRQAQDPNQQSSWLPAGTVTTQPNVPPLSSAQGEMKETIADDLNRGDKLMAVYPEKLVTSAPGGDRGYVRGELAGIQRDFGRTEDVYLGAEEDDDAAEMRNEDKFNDDEREYDQDGREFIKVKPILWRKQFLARNGDPGLNLYKFLERLVRGLVPKLAADTRLRRAIEGSAIKGLFQGEMIPGRTTGTVTDSSGTTRTHHGGVVGAMAHKVAGGIKEAAYTVKDQAKLVEKKIMHHSQDAGLQTDPSRSKTLTTYPDNQPGTIGYVREGDEPTIDSPSARSMETTRPVHGQDADFNRSDLVISGTLEAVWQGRHRLTSLFRRYKQWHVEVKGDTIFYHKVSTLTNLSATDAVWYTLDLTWLQDIFLTESHRANNNELVLQFVQDDNTLHFRLPSKVTTPSLQEWLGAFRRAQRAQQDRRRLGSMALGEEYQATNPRVQLKEVQAQLKATQPPLEEQPTTWPGEDVQPQPRSRGSSLHTAVNVSSNQPATTTTPSVTSTAPTATSSTMAPFTPVVNLKSSTIAPAPMMTKPQEIKVDIVNKSKDLGNFDASSTTTTTTDPNMTRSVAQS